MQERICIPLDIKDSKPSALGTFRGAIEDCIDRTIDMIVFTPKGSFEADPDFGFEYWNHEFSNLNVREFNNSYPGQIPAISGRPAEVTRIDCEQSLRNSIMTYEPSLENPEVKVELDINTIAPSFHKAQPKYQMHILITGSIDDGLGVTRLYEKRISFMVEPTLTVRI